MMQYSSLESPIRDAPNGGISVRLGSIDEEINRKVLKQFFANNLPSNGARRMKIPPFDASHNDESDDMCFNFLRSVETGMRSKFYVAKIENYIYIHIYIYWR